MKIEEQLVDQLTKLPQLINDKAVELFQKKKQLEELKFSQKMVERRIMNEVSSVLNADGKIAFSNTLKREVECEKVLRENEGYLDLMNQLNNLKVTMDNDSLALEFSRNTFTAAKAMTRLIGE